MSLLLWILLLYQLHWPNSVSGHDVLPVVINTWAFISANRQAWQTLGRSGSVLDAVEDGCTSCERDQCDFTVGYGGSPDENGESTLDAMIMDGDTLNVGAVANLRRIKSASAVARKVLELTSHTLLVGDLATEFAKGLGFKEEPLSSNHSKAVHDAWLTNNCQPNFWENVLPDPRTSCGPYSPVEVKKSIDLVRVNERTGRYNHDTIGVAVVDVNGKVAAGTSSNGATHKIPGRVGDSPIPGAGCYADSEVGAAAATGDGDVMMRFLPSFVAVEEMRRGVHPQAAADTALKRISARHQEFKGGIVVLRKDGKFGASCHGLESFPYSVTTPYINSTVITINCSSST